MNKGQVLSHILGDLGIIIDVERNQLWFLKVYLENLGLRLAFGKLMPFNFTSDYCVRNFYQDYLFLLR
jgi:hypothetical protein